MSVAAHLGIAIDEYDRRIRTFIPMYDEMLDAAALTVGRRTGVILDLGIGTGALAARCLVHSPGARIVGVDADPEMLKLAARRLPATATLTRANFLRSALPRADAAIASFALHHVRTRSAKTKFYRRLRKALPPGGIFVSADSHPDVDRGSAAAQREAWLAHLRKTYGPQEAVKLLDSWRDEDVYQPLDVETDLLRRAGFQVTVPWRRDGFAVIRAVRGK